MASFVNISQTAWSALQHSVNSSFTNSLPLLVSLLAILPLLKPFLFPSRQSRALHKVPGPIAYPLVGNLVEFFRKGYHVCHVQWLLAYGPVFKYDMGKGNTVLTVAEPDLVQQIGVRQFKKFHDRPTPGFLDKVQAGKALVFSKGQYWNGVRSAVLPLFHTARLQHFGGIMHECAGILVESLEEAARSGQQVNLLHRAVELTLDVLGSSAFGVKFDNQRGAKMGGGPSLVAAVTKNIESVAKLRVSTLVGMLVPPLKVPVTWLARLVPGSADYTNRKRTEYIMAESQKIIERRRKEAAVGEYRHDFLSMLTQAKNKTTGESLSDEDIRAMIFEFLGAGSETTATTITFAVYCLAKHPTVEQKMVSEIDAFYSKLEKDGVKDAARPTYDELAQFPYVEQVVQETLRLYPAGAVAMREAVEDCHVADLHLPKGTPVLIPIYAMHHDPSVFPEPEAFRPERFSPEEVEKRHPCSYLPFGLGPRMCIGHRFAMEEAKLVLIRIYRRLAFELVEEKLPPGGELEIQVGIVLKPKDGMWVVPHIRPTGTS